MNGSSLSEADENLIEEIEALKAIFSSELDISYSESGRPTRVTTTLFPATAEDVNQQYVRLTVNIHLPPEYPGVVPEIKFHQPRGLSEDFLQEALKNSQAKCQEYLGSPMIYEIIELLRESLTNSNRPTGLCAICLYSFTPEDIFTYTPCYHHYHSHCLLRYVKNLHQQWEEETRQEQGSAQAHLSAKKERELQCPVCREPITIDLKLLRQAPPPMASTVESVGQPNPELQVWRHHMKHLYEKQKAQGGIIDSTEEESRYLIVTAAPTPDPAGEAAQEKVEESPTASQPTEPCPEERDPKNLPACKKVPKSSTGPSTQSYTGAGQRYPRGGFQNAPHARSNGNYSRNRYTHQPRERDPRHEKSEPHAARYHPRPRNKDSRVAAVSTVSSVDPVEQVTNQLSNVRPI